jgi:tryptophan synthase alpha chain
MHSNTLSRLDAMLARRKKMWIPYLMPEFPVPGTTVPVLLALQESGADLIELGIPYSDPLADGPVIQEAATRAIQNGVTLTKLFQWIQAARHAHTPLTIPLIMMGYINPILQYGIDRFLDDAKEAGADGFIIADLPIEEAEEFRQKCIARQLALVFLISPVTSEARIQKIDSLATHFLYAISVNATTGTKKLSQQQAADVEEYLARVRRCAKKPFVVGFGIENAAQAAKILELADGVVVGSALLRHIRAAKTAQEAAEYAAKFWQSLHQRDPQAAY